MKFDLPSLFEPTDRTKNYNIEWTSRIEVTHNLNKNCSQQHHISSNKLKLIFEFSNAVK
jgi:hypothetical protein